MIKHLQLFERVSSLKVLNGVLVFLILSKLFLYLFTTGFQSMPYIDIITFGLALLLFIKLYFLIIAINFVALIIYPVVMIEADLSSYFVEFYTIEVIAYAVISAMVGFLAFYIEKNFSNVPSERYLRLFDFGIFDFSSDSMSSDS